MAISSISYMQEHRGNLYHIPHHSPRIMSNPHEEEARRRVARILALFAAQGNSDYVGEAVSQLAHATQGAKCAISTGADERVVIAALLHDVGHMIALNTPGAAFMGDCGAVNHEVIGALFLRECGLPALTCDLVQQHVDAKRYLVWKNPAYKLSPASRTTLMHQGGPMTDEQAAAFEANPLFALQLKMRTWDEAAKVKDMVVPGLEAYVEIMERLVAAELTHKEQATAQAC